MRVLALLHAYPPTHNAGAEWMMHTLLRALVDRKHEVDVLLSQPHPDAVAPYDLDGVRVHPYRHKNDPFRYLHDASLIVTHLENTPRATILGDLNTVPVVHVLHNTFGASKKWLQRGPAALAVFNSEWMQADYAYHGRQVVVRPPVIAADYATKPGDRVTLINLFERKGAGLFWQLAERMEDVDFLAVTGGYGPQDIRQLPNVDVVPHTPGGRMRDEVYSRTKVLLVPSVYESWGRVGVEAMCSGIPVIAHPTPGLKESLGDAGTFVDRDDIDGWEQEIRRLLKTRSWQAASKKAKARAAELDPAEDLAAWVKAVEAVAKKR